MKLLSFSLFVLLVTVVIGWGAEPPEKVDFSKSRGLKILGDAEFFDKGYRESRLKSLEIVVEYGLNDQQDTNNFFKTKPKISAITKKHGAPDLIVYGHEKYAKKGEDYWITHYFDRIGLITTSKDPETVIFSLVQFYDFSVSNRSRKGSTFDFVGGSNDKIFFVDGREVGRHVYREDESWVTDGQIPSGKFECFRDDRKIFETEITGDSGCFRSYYPSGAIMWMSQFERGRLHGDNKMYSEDGKVIVHNDYEGGLLHGESLVYDETGKTVERKLYRKGKEIESRNDTPESENK